MVRPSRRAEVSTVARSSTAAMMASIWRLAVSDVLGLEVEVVIVGLRAEFDLLERDLRLTLASVVRPLLLFVLELAEVHDLAHGRHGLRVHLDQIEVETSSHPAGFVGVQDAQHFALGSDNTDFRHSNAIVDARTEIPRPIARSKTRSSDDYLLWLIPERKGVGSRPRGGRTHQTTE